MFGDTIIENIEVEEKDTHVKRNIEMRLEMFDDEDGYIGEVEIRFWENGKELYQFGFDFRCDDYNKKRFLLRWMMSPCPGSSLGEKAVRFFKRETNNASIWTRDPLEIGRTDGSQLRLGGPEFVRKMQGLGLIEEWPRPEQNVDDGY